MTSLALILILSGHPISSLSNQPVDVLDLQRYMGQWHEVAHLPMFFQRQCLEHITARYTFNQDGTVQVLNACRTKNGTMDQSIGVARPGKSQGALEVRFAPRWLAWLPMVWADYWVVDLDANYQWVVVGSPSKKYLWILSRNPTMPLQLFEQLKHRAELRGYPVSKLIMSAPLQ